MMFVCEVVNLVDDVKANEVLTLLDNYASDLMGGGEELSQYTKENLISELRKRPTCHIFIARNQDSQEPAGLVISFEGFSTFSCKPLLNLHDVCVLSAYRRKGVAKTLLTFVSKYAQETLGCCKMTLEVLDGNEPAKALYQSLGFAAYELDPTMGKAIFWQKYL